MCVDGRRYAQSGDHRREETDDKENDKGNADLGDELVLAEVLAQGNEGSEVGRRRQRADIQNEGEERALHFVRVAGDLHYICQLHTTPTHTRPPTLIHALNSTAYPVTNC